MIAAAATVEVSVVHALPGRIRFHLSQWPTGGGRTIEKSVRRLAGVRSVRVTRLTQNVLVCFDPSDLSEQVLRDELAAAVDCDEDVHEPVVDDEPLPPVIRERGTDAVQRARIAVRGLDRDSHLARVILRELEKYPTVRAQAMPLTGHVLVEYEPAATPLEDLVARIAELELPPLPDEKRPGHPLDPAPLTQAVVRSVGSALGLSYIALQRLRAIDGSPQAVRTAATVSAVIGLMRSFPLLREELRRICGPNTADALFSLASIVSLAAARSPLGLTVMGVEAYVLLRQVLSQRQSWQRYEDHHSTGPELYPGSVVQLQAGDRVPMRARVIQGTGTAIHRDGLPVSIGSGREVPAGAQLAGGPFTMQLSESKPFVPAPRVLSRVPKLFQMYLRYLGPATCLYAGTVAATTRSLAQTFNALLLVNPRTALGGTEAANLDASTRVTRAGVVVVGSRTDAVIQCPHLMLLDGTRILTDGLELSRVVALEEEGEGPQWLSLAAAVATAAGSPWGRAFNSTAHETAEEGSFDGKVAAAVVGGHGYSLGSLDELRRDREADRLRNRGEYVLRLCEQSGRALALISLRPKLTTGVRELVETCKTHGVRLGIVPGGDVSALQAIAHQAGMPLVVSADSKDLIDKAHRRGALVAFVSDSADAAEAFAAADLAIGIASGRRSFPARVDLLSPNLGGLAAIIEAGVRHDAAARDAVLLSAASNLFGAGWGWIARPGIEKASIPVYLGILSAVSDGLMRMAGGGHSRAALAYLIDPHPERWGLQSVDEVLQALHSGEDGLSTQEARQRRRTTLPKVRRQETLRIIWEQFRYPTTGMLAGAAGLSLVLGRSFDFAIITATIGVNVAVGTWQERQASQAAELLKRMGSATARVLRDGELKTLPATELVPGDMLLLDAGDRVAADARLITADNLQVDEAALTGEWYPITKSAENGSPDNRVVQEGSDIVVGTGRAVVVAVGKQTRMGTMAAAMELDEAEQSPLGARLSKLLWQSLPLTTAASAVVVASGLLRRRPLMPQLVIGASMALAAVPEGLPMLAGMGQGGVARRLARRNALVRRLTAVEALGRVDVACVDKTGTLTEGRLSLSLVADTQSDAPLPGELPPPLAEVLLTAAFASPHPEASGAAAHPTDVAVMQAAEAASLGERLRAHRGSEEPFDPVKGFHVTSINGKLCLKGAPETLLPRCGRLRVDGQDRPLDDAGRKHLRQRGQEYAQRGLRVLMVAEGASEQALDDPQDLTALGYLGIRDPLRATVRESVDRCHAAGVRVMMITGDHPATARSIASEAGLQVEAQSLFTGSELSELDDEQLDQRMEHAVVVARATPLDKLRIIESLQRRGHAVAMTGDGVNDAPALRLADVGVAMGRGGTEVARQAADLVLTDDDFATLVEALVEGRSFWQNMRRALGLLLGGNLGELGLIAGASVLGDASPLNAPQILIVNLITDALPALAVVLQHPEHHDLSELAREGVTSLDEALLQDVVRRALLTAGPSLIAFLIAARRGNAAQANTIAFASIVGNQLAQTLEAGQYENRLSKPVLHAVVGSTAMLGSVLLIGPLRTALGLTLPNLLSCGLIGTSAITAAALSRAIPAVGSQPTPSKL